jgi:hypothetical protein
MLANSNLSQLNHTSSENKEEEEEEEEEEETFIASFHLFSLYLITSKSTRSHVPKAFFFFFPFISYSYTL